MNNEKTFPLRSASQLATIVSAEWGIPVTEHELQKPSPETVQSIYCAILADVLSLDVTKFERDRQVVIGDAEYPVCSYMAGRLSSLIVAL